MKKSQYKRHPHYSRWQWGGKKGIKSTRAKKAMRRAIKEMLDE